MTAQRKEVWPSHTKHPYAPECANPIFKKQCTLGPHFFPYKHFDFISISVQRSVPHDVFLMSLLQNSLCVTHGLLGSSGMSGCRSAPASHCSNSNTRGHQLCGNPAWAPNKAAVDTTASGLYNSPRAGFASYLTTPFIEVSVQGRLQQVALC